jgi:hypothetical protein
MDGPQYHRSWPYLRTENHWSRCSI